MKPRATVPETEEQRVQKSLRNSVLDGSANAAMAGFTQEYVSPFALALNATMLQMGLLSSVPNFVMALAQLVAPRLEELAGSRKRVILPFVFMQALMWLPILFIPCLAPTNKAWWLICLVTVSTIVGSLANPSWGSMMADLVPPGNRGKFFGMRGKICGTITLIFSFGGGIILQRLSGSIMVGFYVLFIGAATFRLISWYFLARMYEPPAPPASGKRESLVSIFRHLGSSNLGHFIIYVSLINMAVSLAGPFWAVYMLRDLHFNYLTYITIQSAASLINLFSLTYWGRRGDLAGNVRVLRITSVLIPLVPALWAFSSQVPYLVLVQVLSGFAWAGYNLSTSNFLYDASTPENRIRYIALYNAMNGTAVCLGALLGGFLALSIPAMFGSRLIAIFVLSGLLRAIIVTALMFHISEVRQVTGVNLIEFMFGKRVVPRHVAWGAAHHSRLNSWGSRGAKLRFFRKPGLPAEYVLAGSSQEDAYKKTGADKTPEKQP